jgi:hypothetical protein
MVALGRSVDLHGVSWPPLWHRGHSLWMGGPTLHLEWVCTSGVTCWRQFVHLWAIQSMGGECEPLRESTHIAAKGGEWLWSASHASWLSWKASGHNMGVGPPWGVPPSPTLLHFSCIEILPVHVKLHYLNNICSCNAHLLSIRGMLTVFRVCEIMTYSLPTQRGLHFGSEKSTISARRRS